ncbi:MULTISPECIES: diaminopimelate decarboxylase [Pseudomonas]|uniref:Diaminopimelate decarboxylase n=1 Tax=Pseudomonas gingeri TaxID=117681 RepID=A0A7Y7WUE2_9PSED|nr:MULTISPECIES: diaminopimelate decarboxylase [Pseudomonas]MPQ68768.1 diaminopimelate decarboxylase [Pseudomonas sp. MWU12-2323]NWB86428.1 diaminopimelate decarboxylase [Pseudomonas gingeri]
MKTLADNLLLQLAEQHGTPLWVYDGRLIQERIRQLCAFDTVRFAQKACSNLHILRLMREAGARVDAVSLGEIERALQAGFSTDSVAGAAGIVFTADVFDRATLQRVVETQVEVNIGSIDMLHQLGPLSSGHRVWLRINPGFGHGHSRKTNTGGENSKHGIWHTQLDEALRLVRDYGLHLVGLHMHIGSGVDYQHLQQVCSTMAELVVGLDQDIEAISAGGGLSVPYRAGEQPVDVDHYFAQWDHARKQIERHLGHPVRLEIEPGRFLVAEAGVLVSEVRATKPMGGNHFTLVDAGFNDLMRPSLYGSYHEISLLTRRDQPLPMRATVVAGPLCESGDVFTQSEGGIVESRLLPSAEVGDYLVFHTAGAYGASMSSNYNSRTQAAEVLVTGSEHRLIRKRQTLSALLLLEEDD